MTAPTTPNTKQELREKIAKAMGWWKYETDDYHAYDSSPKKTDKIEKLISDAVNDVLDDIEAKTSDGVFLQEAIEQVRKEWS